MKRSCLVSLLVAWGCGEDSQPGEVIDASSTGAVVGDDDDSFDDGGVQADLPWNPLPDLPPPDQSCEERGTAFGIVFGPVEVESTIAPASFANVGLTAGTTGLLATYTHVMPDLDTVDYMGVRVGSDGQSNGSPWSLYLSSDAPAGYAQPEETLLTFCHEGEVGWRTFDANGSVLGPQLLSPAYSRCTGDAPAAAWVDNGYLVAWHSGPSSTCPEGCIALAFGTESLVVTADDLRPTFVVTDPLTIAASGKSALVVASHVNPEGVNELALSLVRPNGAPLFPPLVKPFPPVDPPDAQGQAPVAASATDDGGFVVFVGGRGDRFGRVLFDEVASVTVPFEEVPLPANLADADIFRTGLRASPRTGGLVLHGPATLMEEEGPVDGHLMLMVDDIGNVASYEFFPDADSGAVMTYNGRTWVMLGGTSLTFAELGCVF